MSIVRHKGLSVLPIFNPDYDGEDAPQGVKEFRALVGASDGLLIASPEYAHGVSGPMKNALDWLVGGHEFFGKPVALINCSPRAFHAAAQLREILSTMAARVIEPACVSLALLGGDHSPRALVDDPVFGATLRSALHRFAAAFDAAGERVEIRSQDVCPFCNRVALTLVAENGFAFALRDLKPVRPLHTLIIPKRHVDDIFAATAAEREAVHALADFCRDDIKRRDASVGGFNFGSNIGAIAGQKILHAHLHLIPRRADEAPPPPARP